MEGTPAAIQAELEAQLADYVTLRDAIAATKKLFEPLGERLKAWLLAHPDEELVDGEHRLRAYLQEGNSSAPRPMDLNALYDHDPALFLQLLRNGCLRADEKAVKAAGALAAGVDRYWLPKPRTQSLQVKGLD